MDMAIPTVDCHGRIKCPCKKYKNVVFETVDLMEDHLLLINFDPIYTWWVLHGAMIGNVLEDDQSHREDNDTHFTKLWEEAEKEL